MTKELTIKQWARRAMKAEAELEEIRTLRSMDSQRELCMVRENAALRVALREIQGTTNWAYGAIADTLGGGDK